MGDKAVTSEYDEVQMRVFTRAVLNDLQALEQMLESGLIEDDVRRIGAEQEMFLVDSSLHPAPIVAQVMNEAQDGRLTTEIGRFNLEANLTPRTFTGSSLRDMETELEEILGVVRCAAAKFDAGVVLAGILPTIQMSDLTEANLTPNPRYHEINRVVTKLHGENRHIHMKGMDELQLTLQDTFIEFCNTSFQIHLQVGISEFSKYYNWAQAISAPVLAAAVNSPILLNHRLWHETRLALFQHATDTRSDVHKERNQTPRVNFGDRWVGDSILEVLREDAVRFRILLTQAVKENSVEMLARGGIPQLSAWRLHNSTIWRWNRTCYGLVNGRPGLRIEARFLPSGPSVADEMANAAFFLGLMTALPEEFGDVTRRMSFDSAKTNFFNAARYGLQSQILWIDGKSRRAGRLILEELLPRARTGLGVAGIDAADIDRLLGILEKRASLEKTGSQWMLDSLANMDKRAKANVRMRSLTAAMKANQEASLPLHQWQLAGIPSRPDWIDNYKTVEQFMSTDLFTVRPEDVIDLAASLMRWKHVRHVPVENDNGDLVGIVSHRDLLEILALGKAKKGSEIVVRDIMRKDLLTITPDTSALEALQIMRENDIGCLPIVKGEKLVGLITAYDYLTVSAKLFEEKLLGCSSYPVKGKKAAG
jgi:CBS domain-containing protein/gamma-glutamyl:cysteine ligase YbdK (ATP-grasp superfamily)